MIDESDEYSRPFILAVDGQTFIAQAADNQERGRHHYSSRPVLLINWAVQIWRGPFLDSCFKMLLPLSQLHRRGILSPGGNTRSIS